jgi:hypothetical protein
MLASAAAARRKRLRGMSLSGMGREVERTSLRRPVE